MTGSRAGRVVGLVVVVAAAVSVLPATAGAVLEGANGRIVFVSGRGTPSDNGNAKLYLRLTRGTFGGAPLPTGAPALDTTAGQHRHPTWSPDRTKIAYARGGSGGCTPQCDIYTLDLTDPNATPVNVTNTPGATEDRPAWSPDGTRIAYETGANGGGQTDILVDTQPFGSGTNLTLANESTPEGKPAWSPDSQTLYYHRENRSFSMAPGLLEGETANIYKEPANNTGSPSLAVPVTSSAHLAQPSISPDGTKICYTLIPSAGFFNPNAAVMVGNLTTPPTAGNVLAGEPGGNYNCTWSPDGTQVAYVLGFGDPGSLLMKNLNNPTLPIPLEESNGWDGNPDWAPDARPQCQDTTVNTKINTPVEVPLECADTGPAYERTTVSAINSTDPANGTLSPDVAQELPGSLTYTPNQGFTGTDTFTVRSFDAVTFGDRNGTVTVNVRKQLNGFDIVDVKKNKKKGTAKLTVSVDEGPGDIALASKKAKQVQAPVGAGENVELELRVKAKGKAKRKLKTKGKAKVTVDVTYTPGLGDPNTQSQRVKLKRKLK